MNCPSCGFNDDEEWEEARKIIARLHRRVVALEQLIVEEVDVMACRDAANEMLVNQILEQRTAQSAE